MAETTAQKGIVAMEKADVQVGSSGLQLRNIDELFRFAQAVAGSALAPKDFVGKPESVVVAIQMGFEVGLPPMSALQNIAVINGRPSIWGDAQLAIVRSVRENGIRELEAFEETETNNEIEPLFRELCFEDDTVKRKDLKIKIALLQAKMDKKSDDFGVSCFVRRRGFSEAFSRFTVADAKTANLWGKQGPWTQYPFRMLKARARSFLLRDQFGDALKGMMTREEAGDIIDITEVARAEATPGPKVEKAPFRRNPNPVITEVKQAEQPKGVAQQMTEAEYRQQAEQMAAEIARRTDAEAAELAASGLAPTQPGNVIDTKGEVAPDPQKAASAPTAPVAEQSQKQPLESSAQSAEVPKSSASKEPFLLPPSLMPEGWLPSILPAAPEEVSKSFFEWISTEEITPEEIVKWCMSGGRGYAKAGQKVTDLNTSKLSGLLKIREQVRAEILEARQ